MVTNPAVSLNRLAQIVQWFERLSVQSLAGIDSIYSTDADFRDPFNHIRGLPGIRAVYQHMFDTLEAPRFVIGEVVANGPQAFIVWDFHFSMRGRPLSIHGCTHFVINDVGLITVHRDYWDAAEELYEKLPILGALMRLLKRKIALPESGYQLRK
jgi:hypothetical protein